MTALLTDTTGDLTTHLDEELRRSVGERPSRQAVRNLATSAAALAGIALSAWKCVRETLAEEGFEGRELARHCRVLLAGIDVSLAARERLLTLAEASDLTPEAIGLNDLEARLPDLREARPELAKMLGIATQPPRPIDEARLAESRAALERGEFVTVDDEYLARLRAGGDF